MISYEQSTLFLILKILIRSPVFCSIRKEIEGILDQRENKWAKTWKKMSREECFGGVWLGSAGTRP